jgi:hypothetical protein
MLLIIIIIVVVIIIIIFFFFIMLLMCFFVCFTVTYACVRFIFHLPVTILIPINNQPTWSAIPYIYIRKCASSWLFIRITPRRTVTIMQNISFYPWQVTNITLKLRFPCVLKISIKTVVKTGCFVEVLCMEIDRFQIFQHFTFSRVSLVQCQGKFNHSFVYFIWNSSSSISLATWSI